MPHGTRKRVARALQMLRNKRLENPWKKHDNIPPLSWPGLSRPSTTLSVPQNLKGARREAPSRSKF